MMSLVRAQLGEPKEYSLSTVGVDDAEGLPVPIPNTEVKLSGAENSALATGCENREMPTLDSEYFFILKISRQLHTVSGGYFCSCRFCFIIEFIIFLIVLLSNQPPAPDILGGWYITIIQEPIIIFLILFGSLSIVGVNPNKTE